MCGISGILKLSGDVVDPGDLRRMSSALRHRGPDGAGYAILDGGGLGLGHVRLSVIDLASGSQPLFSADQSVCVVFNGEIYDHASLRAELIARGRCFRTSSDTEVLVQLYEEHGLDLLSRLNGEFAFLLWDARRRRLLAVKDRMGVKPLFYRRTATELLFASEAKAILSLERVSRAISTDYLTGPFFGAFPSSVSLFAGVTCLKPGHLLRVEDGRVQGEETYWRPTYQVRSRMSFEEAAEGVRRHVALAVRRRLVADVPVCTYLSGGIDSSVVCGLLASEGSRPKAFNVGFPGFAYDEASNARRVADHYDIEFETLDCPLEKLAEGLPRTLYHTETQLTNPAAVGKFLLSELVYSQGYRVAITGEGADEVFAGYPYFKLEHLWRLMQRGGADARRARALWSRFKRMEAQSEGTLWNRKDRWRTIEPIFGFPSFLHVRGAEYGELAPRMLNLDRMGLGPDAGPALLFRERFPVEQLRALHPLHASLMLTRNQLAGHVIPTLGDRVEMAHSIEGRTPFLDRDLLEFAQTIPPDYFIDINELREKHVLREAFTDLVPAFARMQPKRPFYAPDWWSLSKTRIGKELFGELMSTRAIAETGLFNPRFISTLLALWRALPRWAALHKRLDAVMGGVTSVQVLAHVLVRRRPESDARFPMRDRTPTRAWVA